MSMMDLQGALGGAPPGGGGPPGGGPPSISIPGGPPGAEQGGPPEGEGTSIDYLDAAEEALNQFIQVDPDEVDRAKASKALQIVLDLKAANQTDTQQGGMKSLQRALAGAGGGPGGPPMPGGPQLG
jgi:hypothetical protein